MFDVAKRFLVVDVDGDSEVSREETRIERTEPTRRAQRVAELGVHTLNRGESYLLERIGCNECEPTSSVCRASSDRH